MSLVVGLVFVVQIMLCGILAVLTGMSLFYLLKGGVPFVPTAASYLRRIVDTLDLKPDDRLYDLGSGDGRMLLYCARRYPEARFVGIERNPFVHLMAKLRWFFAGMPRNVSLVRGDMFTTNFSDATHLFVFLLPGPMSALFPPGRTLGHIRLVSRAFPLTWRPATRTVAIDARPGSFGEHMLYIYDFY